MNLSFVHIVNTVSEEENKSVFELQKLTFASLQKAKQYSKHTIEQGICLAIALITHKRITTTLAKAKALRVFIEPLVTKSRNNTTHSRRTLFSYLQNKEAVQEIFGTIAAKVGDRPGGYVRILHKGFRKGAQPKWQ